MAEETLSSALRLHGRVCGDFGSPFFRDFLGEIAADVDAGGPATELLAPWIDSDWRRRKRFSASICRVIRWRNTKPC